MNSEDSAADEQTVHYDIRFTANVPGTGAKIALIINVEIQADDRLGYQVVTRGLYYCARMISAQYGTVFTHSEYQKIQKVYSIWICPDSVSRQHSVTEYRITEQIRLGNLPVRKEDYDKLHVVVITLGPNGTESPDDLVKYLSLILTNEIPLEARKRELEEHYRIEMTHTMEEEMSGVCNLGEAIARRNMEAGIAQGRAQGHAEGMLQGRAEGMLQGRAEGEKRMSMLIARLVSMNRFDDVKRCTEDPEYREKLYREFQLA